MKRIITMIAACALACAAYGFGNGDGDYRITNIVYDKGEWVVDTNWTLETNDIIRVNYDPIYGLYYKAYYSDGYTNRVKAPFPNKSKYSGFSIWIKHMHKYYMSKYVYNPDKKKKEWVEYWEWRSDANCYYHRCEYIDFAADGGLLWGGDWCPATNKLEVIKRPTTFTLH